MHKLRSGSIVLAILVSICALPAAAGPGDRSFQARLGGFFPDGKSDFWDDTESVFTLDSSDFDDAVFGITFSHAVGRFLDLDVNADFYDATVLSEYLDYTDGGGFPIFHDSTLETTPLTVGLRLIPFGRGQHENKPVVFVGAGGGVNFWRYEEVGDFIDFSDPGQPIEFGVFEERGAAFVWYAAAGVEIPVGPFFSIGVEGRYFGSDDTFDGDFAGLGRLDMSGAAASVSGTWRF